MNSTRSQQTTRLILLGGITLLSGAAALIFETLWTRSFSLMLGSTVQAASAVFAAFLTALASGAYAGGRWTARLQRPLVAYGLLEFAIGLTGVIVGLALHWWGATLAGHLRPFLEWNRAFAAYFEALIPVFIPTFLMGMTFPWIVSLAKRSIGTISFIYGANTFGAALGTLGCGFFFIRWLGIEKSLILGAILNCVSGLLAMALLHFSREGAPEGSEEETHTAPQNAQHQHVPESALLFATAISGFVTLGVEIVWLRYGSFFLGNRTYAFSTMLAAVLVLLSVGSWLAGWIIRRRVTSNALLGAVFLCSCLGIIFSSEAVNYWIRRQDLVEPLLPGAANHLLFYRGLEALMSLAPVLLPLGILFPLTLSLARDSQRSLGPTAGRYYFLNTIGTVAGSILTGFVGMTCLGANSWGRLLALACLVSSVLFFLLESTDGSRLLSRVGLLLAAAVGGLFVTPGAPLQYVHPGEHSLFRKEDEYGVFQVAGLSAPGLARVSNNKTDLVFLIGSAQTDYVQQMQGHLGMFYNPSAKRVAVLGSGYGITAGAFSAYPDLEHIDAVEILPIMVEVTSQFEEHNLGYFNDPRVKLVVDDGRHFLARVPTHYDIISVNVSDPRLPGGSALFHTEFYQLVKTRLNEGGIFLQHVFGAQLSVALATLSGNFRHVRCFPAYQNGFNVVASDEPLVASEKEVARLTSSPKVAAAFARIGVVPPLSPVQILTVGFDLSERKNLFAPGSPLATDDHPYIEFSWSENAIDNFFSND